MRTRPRAPETTAETGQSRQSGATGPIDDLIYYYRLTRLPEPNLVCVHRDVRVRTCQIPGLRRVSGAARAVAANSASIRYAGDRCGPVGRACDHSLPITAMRSRRSTRRPTPLSGRHYPPFCDHAGWGTDTSVPAGKIVMPGSSDQNSGSAGLQFCLALSLQIFLHKSRLGLQQLVDTGHAGLKQSNTLNPPAAGWHSGLCRGHLEVNNSCAWGCHGFLRWLRHGHPGTLGRELDPTFTDIVLPVAMDGNADSASSHISPPKG